MIRFLAIVPARGGSKRLPGKNLALLAGRPLLDYTAEAAHGARSLAATVISTDDPVIAARARALGLLDLGRRPSALAGDESPTTAALQHALAAYEAVHGRIDAVVLLQPTSPLRTARHIDEACELFLASGADTVTAVRATTDHPWWTWRRSGDALAPFVSTEAMTAGRDALPELLIETGAVYVVRRDLVAEGRLYGDRVVGYPMDPADAVDVDTALDLAFAELVLSRRDPARAAT